MNASFARGFASVGCWLIGCCLLVGTGTVVHAQPHPVTPGLTASRVVVPRSVVLKPAVPEAGTPRFFPVQREMLVARTRLDTISRGRRDRWLAADKAKHTAAGFALTLSGQYVFEEKARLDRDPALALSLTSGAAVGLAKELYDKFVDPTGHFSVKDLAADALGLLLAAGVVLL